MISQFKRIGRFKLVSEFFDPKVTFKILSFYSFIVIRFNPNFSNYVREFNSSENRI
jgi:hypothetical protein